MHLHNIIKIKYVNMGFLPNTPYHLISDAEMFEAFLKKDGFFEYYYPCPGYDFQQPYNDLLGCITSCIEKYQNGQLEELPIWIYQYMLMSATTYESPPEDIDYICEMGNIDQPDLIAVFTPQVASTCLEVSYKWLQKMPSKHGNRPPTMFGETHVIKSLRLTQANILLDSEIGVSS